jgi:hypothetical protein
MKHHASKFNRCPRWWGGLMLSVLVISFAAVNSALAQSEEGIKAAFVYNFAKFTEWPTNAFTSGSAPMTVGFVGADSLADTFEKIVSGKNINGHDFVIRRFSSIAGVENCQMVFVGETAEAAAVISLTVGKPILTIGDTDSFAAAGGMIKLFKNDKKIRFDLDFRHVNSAQLKLDARLCQLARSIKGR